MIEQSSLLLKKIKASYDNAGLDTEKKVEFRCLDLGTGKEISEIVLSKNQ